MSAHNSVKMAVGNREQERRHALLTLEFERARKRAEKKGRNISSAEEYHDHWG